MPTTRRGFLQTTSALAGDKVWVTQGADGYVVIRAKGMSLKSLLRDAMVESSLCPRGRVDLCRVSSPAQSRDSPAPTGSPLRE